MNNWSGSLQYFWWMCNAELMHESVPRAHSLYRVLVTAQEMRVCWPLEADL